jgi:glycosyltransferase involved in cell wall biosynthesis
LKILLAHNKFYTSGGDDVFFREVGRVLEKNSHKVAYLSVQDARNERTPWQSYFPPAVNYLEGSLMKRILKFGGNVYSRVAKKKTRELLRHFNPDIVHAFSTHVKLTPSVLDACREAGVPVVMSCNDYKHICPNYKLFHHGQICELCRGGRFYNAALMRCCKDSFVYSVASSLETYVHNLLNIYRKNLDRFLFASKFMARKTEEFWDKDTFKWSILRNPFDSNRYTLKEAQGGYLLFFGRLIEEKGIDVLIRALQYVPEARLVIVGNGPQQPKLEIMVKNLRLDNVEFVGPKWGEALNGILRKARFVVVPSVWHENFPYAILESFASGNAVIGSDRGGIPELVRHGEFGYLYPALDHKALAEKISVLWQNPSLARSMGKAAKEWTDVEFNEDRFYQNIMDIYEEVAK